MKRHLLLTCVALILPLGDQRHATADDDTVLAAVVGDQKIYLGELRRTVHRAATGQKLTATRAQELARAALQQAIKRRLVLQYVAKRGMSATADEIDHELTLVTRQLAEQDLTLEAYLQRSGLTQDELRFSLAWQVGWGRWLKRFTTDANLEKYFNRHRRDFDGTQLEVAHILWKVNVADQDAVQHATQQADSVRKQILAGEISFAAAAQEHSAAPTKTEGGAIGLISRHAPMPEAFSSAAFELEQGDISPPVVSPVGIHLIQCVSVKAGQRQWREVKPAIRQAVEHYLFDWTEQQQSPHSEVQVYEDVLQGFSLESRDAQ